MSREAFFCHYLLPKLIHSRLLNFSPQLRVLTTLNFSPRTNAPSGLCSRQPSQCVPWTNLPRRASSTNYRNAKASTTSIRLLHSWRWKLLARWARMFSALLHMCSLGVSIPFVSSQYGGFPLIPRLLNSLSIYF